MGYRYHSDDSSLWICGPAAELGRKNDKMVNYLRRHINELKDSDEIPLVTDMSTYTRYRFVHTS